MDETTVASSAQDRRIRELKRLIGRLGGTSA
jgi:hypothetical protein